MPTEPIDSLREQSIRSKMLGYEAYQDSVLHSWRQHRPPDPAPRFRVVFLTKTETRVKHILWMAGDLARNNDRHLCLAATQDEFLQESYATTRPILLDHHGRWQSLVALYPSSQFLREPVWLSPPVAQPSFA